ncbi:MAG TPA: response regulator [Bradyrhizobium sp.]|nr:response regulator [Bradyrhizobium sp.]
MMPAISSDDDDQSSDAARRCDRASDILVVDDETAVCRTIEHLLRRNGYAVTVCAEGLRAVDLLAQRDFAVALVDLNLSDVHGSQAIRAARAVRPALPIVVMSGLVAESGRSPPDFLGMSIRIGGLYRLTKPFKPQDLLDLIAQILASPPRQADMSEQTLAVRRR